MGRAHCTRGALKATKGGCTCANGAGANHNQVSTVTLLLCVEEATPTATAVQLPAKSESMKQRVALAQTCTPATTAVLPKYNTESCNTVSQLATEHRGLLSTSRLPLHIVYTTPPQHRHACLLGKPLRRPLSLQSQPKHSPAQHSTCTQCGPAVCPAATSWLAPDCAALQEFQQASPQLLTPTRFGTSA